MTSNIAEFYERVNADPALMHDLFAASGSDLDTILENAVRIGSSIGYEFSVEEARVFGATLDELPEELLDAVAGGAPTSCSTENTALKV